MEVFKSFDSITLSVNYPQMIKSSNYRAGNLFVQLFMISEINKILLNRFRSMPMFTLQHEARVLFEI